MLQEFILGAKGMPNKVHPRAKEIATNVYHGAKGIPKKAYYGAKKPPKNVGRFIADQFREPTHFPERDIALDGWTQNVSKGYYAKPQLQGDEREKWERDLHQLRAAYCAGRFNLASPEYKQAWEDLDRQISELPAIPAGMRRETSPHHVKNEKHDPQSTATGERRKRTSGLRKLLGRRAKK